MGIMLDLCLQEAAFDCVHLTLQAIEGGLSEQISYLTQVSTHHPHEGSAYGPEKVRAWILVYFE